MSEKDRDFNTKVYDLESKYAAFAKVMENNYISIAEVDLCTNNAVILKSTAFQELVGSQMPWPVLLEKYAEHRAYVEDRSILASLSYDCLNRFLEQGQRELKLEIRCKTAEVEYIWAEVKVSIVSLTEKRLLITTRSIDEQRLMKSIVEQFVFQNFDYFILLNAKNNTYTMFGGDRNGVPLPPEKGDDYTAEVARYNAEYVLPEEYERVTANMQIKHVLAMLEHKKCYSFSCRGISISGTLRRSRVQFQYYDKVAGLILLTRTDITQIFQEEQAKNERLTKALFDAQHDALTGLLNQKGIEMAVIDSLHQMQGKQAAFLFIDVDNFKMVNDTLGHQKGDELLCFLAESMQKIAGRAGIAGRIGGDEFLLYLSDISSIEEVANCAGQVCRTFDSFALESMKTIPVSCSVGISTYPKDGTEYGCLLRKADQALYTSKRYGKNRFYFYSKKMHGEY